MLDALAAAVRRFPLFPAAGLLALSAGCRCEAPANERAPAPFASGAAPSNGAAVPGEATTLLEWNESAYGNLLFVDGPTVLVLTPTAAIRVAEGTPPQSASLPFGAAPAMMGDAIVYWHDGAARAASRSGSELRVLGRIERQPQRFVASERGLAWLERSGDGTFALYTFDGASPRVIHRTREHVATAAMLGDAVFFVTGETGGAWRIGSVSVRAGGTAFSALHQGRTPSMLVPAADGIYFYDGPTRSVRRASSDLKDETVIAENVICSPLAVAAPERVVCGHVEGVFEIPGKGQAPRVLSPLTKGSIAAIAADAQRAVWLVDVAENRFALRATALPPPPRP